MTRLPEPNDHDQTADLWLAQHQHALAHALDDLLDTEAGLREILLQSHHDAATDHLDAVLDTEAGLAAILPSVTPSPADAHSTQHQDSDVAAIFGEISPADRLNLRSIPDIERANQALNRARKLDAVDRDDAISLAVDLANALARDLEPLCALARHFECDVDLVRALDDAVGLAVDLARTLRTDYSLAHANVVAIDLVAIADVARAQICADDRMPNRSLDAAHVIARNHARALDLDHAIDLAEALERPVATIKSAPSAIVEMRTAEVGRAISLVLRRRLRRLDKELLYALLDDFTENDLSDADLTGVDLSGVHWSEHTTQWPATVDVGDLKARSYEAPLGSGTWVVRSGTATIRDLAER